MDAIKSAAAAEVSKGHLVEVSDGSYTSPKQDVSTAATEQIQKRGPGRPRNEDKIRGSASKSAAVSESETTLSNSSSTTESPAVPVNPAAKSSSQKKFGGKRKVHWSYALHCGILLYSHAEFKAMVEVLDKG